MKAEDLLVACPKCGEWPMVPTSARSYFLDGARYSSCAFTAVIEKLTLRPLPCQNEKPAGKSARVARDSSACLFKIVDFAKFFLDLLDASLLAGP